MNTLPKIALGAWAWGNDGTFGGNLTADALRPIFEAGIIKYSFWQQVYQNENAVYACLNMEALPVPEEIRDRSVVISGDSAQAIQELVS